MKSPSPPGTRSRRSAVLALALPMALLTSVTAAASGVRTATTATPANTWIAAGVALPENGTTETTIDSARMTPGSTGRRCVLVAYTGTAAGVVRLQQTRLTDGGSAATLNLKIEAGSGNDPGCRDFRSSATLFSGTLTKLAAAGSLPYAWQAIPDGYRTYRFTWQLPEGADHGTSSVITWIASSS